MSRALRAACALIAIALLSVVTASAWDSDKLYTAAAIVTGTGEENRQIGFRLALEDVIVRVSGDYELISSGAAKTMLDTAPDYVDSFSYRDRYEGIPIHDEQGTHDRPHDLTVNFDPDKIDAELILLGRQPWLAERPHLAVVLGVKNAKLDFVLSSDSDQGFYMRDALAAASEKIAVPVALPSTAAIADAGLTSDVLGTFDAASLDARAGTFGGDRVLAGTLVWSDEALGWIATWRLYYDRKERIWDERGISFDDAFRHALRGAAKILSGNGDPE
jgi:hypothetical protein